MACPFIEASHRACRKVLTIRNLDKALTHCGNYFGECRVYKDLFQRKMIRRQIVHRKIA